MHVRMQRLRMVTGVDVCRFAGAYPPESYHWLPLGRADLPFYDPKRVPVYYYGKTLYEDMGSPAHVRRWGG
jgi:hypothetical protein